MFSRALLLVGLSLSLAACAHRLVVETTPPDAQVHALDSKGRRTKLLGRTPLVLENVDAPALQGILVEKPGFVPRRVDVPFDASSDVRLDLEMQALDRDFVAALPPEALRAVIDMKMGDLVSFQQTLFATNPEEGEREIAAQQPKLGGTAAFHYIVGSWQFYLGRYDDATRSFRRSLELAPEFTQAKRMLVLTDVKSISRTQVARTRAFGILQAAASEIATIGDGYMVRTKSNDALSEPDGFEVILPSDALFKPTTAKLRKEGLPILTQLGAELKKLDQAYSVTVEAHTDSDFLAEMRNVPGAVVSGKPAFKTMWELSSSRATAVLELLRSEGVMASLWSIAGYGDTRPLLVRSGPTPRVPAPSKGNTSGISTSALPADGSLTRRIVVRVSLLGRTVPLPTVSTEESERLKASLKMFLENEDDNAAAPRIRGRGTTGINGSDTSSSAGSSAPESEPARDLQRGVDRSGLARGRNAGGKNASESRESGLGGGSPGAPTGVASQASPSSAEAAGGSVAPRSGSRRNEAIGKNFGSQATQPARPSQAAGAAASAQRKLTTGTALSAKPLPPAKTLAPQAAPASVLPKRVVTPPPVREVVPGSIPRPRIPSLKPQVGSGAAAP